MEKKLTELIDKALTRRSFMARSSAAAAAAVAVAGSCSPLVVLPLPVSPLLVSKWQKHRPLLLIPMRTFSISR